MQTIDEIKELISTTNLSGRNRWDNYAQIESKLKRGMSEAVSGDDKEALIYCRRDYIKMRHQHACEELTNAMDRCSCDNFYDLKIARESVHDSFDRIMNKLSTRDYRYYPPIGAKWVFESMDNKYYKKATASAFRSRNNYDGQTNEAVYKLIAKILIESTWYHLQNDEELISNTSELAERWCEDNNVDIESDFAQKLKAKSNRIKQSIKR